MHTTSEQARLHQVLPASVASSRRTPLFSETYIPAVMPRFLGTFDLLMLFIMNLLWVSNITGAATGGPAAFSYWLICTLLFFLPSCLVVAQLGRLFPHQGSVYNWTYHALGRFWSFFVGMCAWLPGVLSLVNALVYGLSCVQALNSTWLVPAWQQGLVICGLLLFTGVLASRRARMLQHLINATTCFLLLSVLLIAGAAVCWLLTGHASATNFRDQASWLVSFGSHTSNVGLLGTVTLSLLGAYVPLTMAGEMRPGNTPKSITRHLLWGALITLLGYFLLTWALLTVLGTNAALQAVNPLALLISLVDLVFGKLAGDVVAIAIMSFFVIVAVAENAISARLLQAAAIDRRISLRFAQLNAFRVPAQAVWLQTGVAVALTVFIYFLVPLLTVLGDPANLPGEFSAVIGASLLLVWAFSFIFPFLDIAILYLRAPQALSKQLLVPWPVLAFSVLTGPLVCLATMGITLTNSWLPSLLPNTLWSWAVGLLLLACLVVCGVLSMFSSSQATFEGMSA